MVVEELGDRGLDEQGDLRLREALPYGHERRRRQDRVADPVRATNQDPLHRTALGQLCNTTRVHSSNPSSHWRSIRTAHSSTCRFLTSLICASFTASFSVVTIRSAPACSAALRTRCRSSTEYA